MDVEDVKFVINFDYPSCSEDYVHRIGRTARSNNTGTAYTFFTNSNQKQASDLIQVLQEANQVINPKLRSLAETSYGGPGGRNRYHTGGSLGARRNNGMFGRSFGGKSFNNSSRGAQNSDRNYSSGKGSGYSGKGSSYNSYNSSSSSYNNNTPYTNSNFNNKASYKGNKSHDHSQSNGFPMNGNASSGQFSSFGGQQNTSQATQQPSSYTGFNY